MQRRLKRKSGSGSTKSGSGSTSSSGKKKGLESELIFASADVKYEAEFLKNYLFLDKVARKNMSHHLTMDTSRIGSKIKGLVVSCTYSGKDCLYNE